MFPTAARPAARLETAMLDCIDWLDAHNGSVVAVATLALLGVTFWYARTTARLLNEAREQRSILVAQALSQALLSRANSGAERLQAAHENNPSAARAVLGPVRDLVKSDNERAAKIIADLQAKYDATLAT